jgi:hypothetical protein
VAVHFHIPPYMCEGCNTHLHQYILLSIFLITDILVSRKWYLIVVLICIFLTTKDVEHLFICSLAICLPSLEKYLFKPFAHFYLDYLCLFTTEL